METVNLKLELKATAKCPRCKTDSVFGVQIAKDTELHVYLNKAVKIRHSCVICDTDFFVNKIETIKQFGE